jgi:Raf kinase inhibitor-like YbhB/YbcL family protein
LGVSRLELASSAFEHESDIPDRYTCRGRNISPPLSFRGSPDGTCSHALIMEDPDTPFGTIAHWVLYNLPPGAGALSEGVPPGRLLADGICQGRNGMFRFGYVGPCPPWGRHRYLFRLFALDTTIQPGAALSKRKLLRIIRPHVLGQTTLLGYFARKR